MAAILCAMSSTTCTLLAPTGVTGVLVCVLLIVVVLVLVVLVLLVVVLLAVVVLV